jgi:hypothetical protein
LEHVIKKKMPSVVLYHYGVPKSIAKCALAKSRVIVGMINPSWDGLKQLDHFFWLDKLNVESLDTPHNDTPPRTFIGWTWPIVWTQSISKTSSITSV